MMSFIRTKFKLTDFIIILLFVGNINIFKSMLKFNSTIQKSECPNSTLLTCPN